METDESLFVRRGGDGGPILLLLHGLGGTADVWDGLIASLGDHWPGSWLAPDLPGHGRSTPLRRYSFAGLAAAVAPAVPSDVPLAVMGHSLGGAVALTLGTGWFGVRPSAVAGLGIKVRWSSEELAKAAEVATRPSRRFADRDQAVDRALRVAGLAGLVAPDSAFAHHAVSRSDEGFGLALDPGCFAVGAPDMEGLLSACRASVVLVAGEHDPMSPIAHLRPLVPDPIALEGLGHNVHVEQPRALLPIVDRLASLTTP